MSLSSTSSATGQRAVTAAAVAVALLAPIAFLFAQMWSTTGHSLAFTAAERRGVAYLGPMTELLSVATEAQSTAVRGKRVDVTAVRSAIAEVDEIDRRVGAELRTTDRWATIRETVRQRASRSWPVPSVAYTQFSDLVTSLMELNRKVGDTSKLILDPELDSYYVMSAALLRVPEILVDSGRYADLTLLASATGTPDSSSAAQLTTARNRVATNATDLGDGLVKAFAETGSRTLGPGLTRQLDNFRTAVDAVAPSNSLLAPPPERSLSDLGTDQVELQRTALALQRSALTELDLLLRHREDATERTRLLSMIAVAVGVLVVAGAAIGLRPAWPGRMDRAEPDGDAGEDGPERSDRLARPEPERRPGSRPISRAGPGPDPADDRGAEHRGGARAAR